MKKAEGVRAQFKTVAVIDWLEVTLALIDNTQFRYVRDQLGVILGTAHPPYVKPISPGPGGVTTKFVWRFQDPHTASLENLGGVMTALALVFPFAAPPTVTGIELSVDFFPRTVKSNVADLVHRLQLSIDAHGNPRQYDPGKSPLRARCNRYLNPDLPEPVTGLKIDSRLNLRIGDDDDAIQYQVYDKQTDNNGKSLAPHERRARAEFTLSGAELAERVHGPDAGLRLVKLSDLKTFKFESLAGLLHFRHFKPINEITSNAALAKMLEKTLPWREHGITNYNIGMTAFYQDERRPGAVRRSVPRLHSTHTCADDELNDIVRRSFRTLTKDFCVNF
jgi:hypothetical protein